jgi:hypothetical protein
VPGPFYRLESPTQTTADANAQQSSGEIMGKPARGSSIPSVKAYRGKITAGVRGIEFDSSVSPAVGSGTPYEAKWYLGFTTGVSSRTISGVQHAAIGWTRFDHKQP